MQFFKKHMKQLGTIVTLLALFFVVWKMVTMDVDYGAFATPRATVILVLSILLQALIFCYMTFPWLHLVRILSGKKISGKQALPVYTKANLMKYIPGNVFQYVARNKLASEANISHVDVALATVLDIGMSMLAPFLISLLLMRRQIFTVLAAYQKTFLLVLLIGIAAVCLFLALVRWKFRDKLHAYFEKYRRLLRKKTLGQLALAFLLYLLQSVLCVGLYALPLLGVVSVPAEKIPQFLGAYLFSWIVGFITPGSPGGIGIREAVTSPTYTIVNEYLSGRMPLFHFDMYRLSSSEELFDIGWEDYLARGGVCAVEWSENVADALTDAISITIEKDLAQLDWRKITIEGGARFEALGL